MKTQRNLILLTIMVIVLSACSGSSLSNQTDLENKYSSGEALEPGDTNCDLFIREDINVDDFVN